MKPVETPVQTDSQTGQNPSACYLLLLSQSGVTAGSR